MRKIIMIALLSIFTMPAFAETTILLQNKYDNTTVETKINADGDTETTITDFGLNTVYLQIRDLIAYELEASNTVYRETVAHQVDSEFKVYKDEDVAADYTVQFHPIFYITTVCNYSILVEVFDTDGNLIDKNLFIGTESLKKLVEDVSKDISRYIQRTL